MLTHLVEILASDELTSLAQGKDKLGVVEGENDVGDLNFGDGGSITSRARLRTWSIHCIDQRGSSMLDGHLLLNILDQVLFEAHSRRHSILVITTRLPELIVVPLTVAIGVDPELDSVVTSGDGGHVPLELLDLAALIQVSQRNGKEESNQDAKSNGRGDGVVLVMLLFLGLDALELSKEEGFTILAVSIDSCWCNPKVSCADIDLDRCKTLVLDLSLHGGLESI